MSSPTLRPVSTGHSLFAFISDYCLAEQSGSAINMAFHRLCTLMRKMNVKTAVVEDILESHAEIREEILALNTYYKQEVELKTYRITFLPREIARTEELKDLKNEDFLSSTIVINFKEPNGSWRSYLFRSIVTIPKIIDNGKFGTIPLLNNYLHIYKTFKCYINVSENDRLEFNISGTFFCQQNSVTSVCVHAALCMIINNMVLPNHDIISTEDINSIVGINHTDVKIDPAKGLNIVQISTVLQALGLTFASIDFFQNPNFEYNDHVYRYIESRCPTLLVFTTGNISHVVPVLGHTLNTDMWKPEAESAYSSPGSRLDYKSASAWVDHFIIHDDNFGMYYCLPVDSLKRITLPKYDPTFRAYFSIMVIPPGVTTLSWEAEFASSIIVKDMLGKLYTTATTLGLWTDRVAFSPRPLVIRTFLVNKTDYKKSLELKDFEGNSFSETDKEELIRDLPDCFWLSEITLPDLFMANKTKVIDFFYGCNNSILQNYDDIFQRWLQIRFPDALMKNTGQVIPLNVSSHYPLLRFGNIEDTLNW